VIALLEPEVVELTKEDRIGRSFRTFVALIARRWCAMPMRHRISLPPVIQAHVSSAVTLI
jgi:hypothetical protein